MKKLITLFSIALAISFGAQAQLQLEWAATAPTIDGFADDEVWGGDWVAIALEAGEVTHAAQFQIANDDENIYVIVKVDDATPNYEHANEYEIDCVEFFTSFHSPSGETPEPRVAGQDFQTRVNRGGIPTADLQTDGTAEYEFAVEDDAATTWTLEMAYTIEQLATDTDFDYQNFRFDIQVADNTGAGRTGQLFWADNSDLQWQNVEMLGAAVLAEEGANSIAAALATSKASAYVVGSELIVKNMAGAVSVFDAAGKLVAKGNADKAINVADLRNGLYIARDAKASVKFIK